MMGIVTVLILALIGGCLIIAGAYVLAGAGAALVTSGVLALSVAKIMSRGLNG